MATANQRFVVHTNADLIGATVQAAGALEAVDASASNEMVKGGNVTTAGLLTVDPSADGYTKHGAATITLTSTTPVTVDLTNLASNTASSTGDLSFATWNRLTFEVKGAGNVTIAPGGSNPANGIASGTTPTIPVLSGGFYAKDDGAAGNSVDSSHKTITITPTANTTVYMTVSGA
jgi:hypothetical protein